jgi:putative transposase
MRVQSPKSRRRRTLDEEKTQPRADRPQATPGGRKTRLGGVSVPEVARELGVSEATYHRWRNRYAGTNPSETKRLKELEKENARLKKIVAEQAVDISILKEVSKGNF